MTCKRRRCNDEWQCGPCGLCWDVKDPDPPVCIDAHERHQRAMAKLWEDEPEVDSVSAKPIFRHGVGYE